MTPWTDPRTTDLARACLALDSTATGSVGAREYTSEHLKIEVAAGSFGGDGGVAQYDSALRSGRRGPEFKSRLSDQTTNRARQESVGPLCVSQWHRTVRVRARLSVVESQSAAVRLETIGESKVGKEAINAEGASVFMLKASLMI